MFINKINVAEKNKLLINSMFNGGTQKNVKVKKKKNYWHLSSLPKLAYILHKEMQCYNLAANNAPNLMTIETTPTSTDSLTRENVKSEVAKTLN